MRTDVRTWFDRRTYSGGRWTPRELQSRKAAAGSRVSVVLPALNEEATVGAIVATIRQELVDRVPLVDELVVMDSASTDATAAVAAAAGARVVHIDDVLPDSPSVPGKGEVLWKALYATTGDIVVYVDADLEQFSARFITGLLGPLLDDPAVHYVKATYDRPLATADGVSPTGGGRVTELVARPLLNRFWPELAGFVQPLSGEYAGRRAVLEQVPFVSGYGVEIGLLVDLLALVGLDGLAQVDLGRRVHSHHGDAALGRMAGQVLHTVLARAGLPSGEPQLEQFFRGTSGEYQVVSSDVSVSQRPPMREVPAYQERRVSSRAGDRGAEHAGWPGEGVGWG